LKIIHAKLTSWQNGIVLAPPGDGGCGIAAGVALHLDLAALAGHHGLRGVVRDDGRSPHRQLHLGADFVDGGYHHLADAEFGRGVGRSLEKPRVLLCENASVIRIKKPV